MRLKIYNNIFMSAIGCFLIVSCNEPNRNMLDSKSNLEGVTKANTHSDRFTKQSYKNISIGDKFNPQLLQRNTDVIDDCFNAISRIENKNIIYQIENGTVAVISTTELGFESYSGVKIGDNLQDVFSHHKNETPEIIDNPYGVPNKNKIITYWYSPKNNKGIRYDVDNNIVTGMSIGNSSIMFSEGCL